MGMGGFALLLRYIPWWQAALLAGAALVFNLVVLPRVGRALYRPDDRSRRIPTGIVLYPVAVLLLILIFPYRLDIAAAAWGVLAVGDGMATIVGRRARGRRIPWNREKTVAGSVALFVFGGLAAAGLAWWCRPSADSDALPVVLAGRAVRGCARRGVRGNDPRQAERQRLGSGHRSSRIVGVVPCQRGSDRVGGDRGRSRASARTRRQHHRRVARLPRGDRVASRRDLRSGDRRRDCRRGRMARLDAALRDVSRRVDQLAARLAAQDAARDCRRARGPSRRWKRDRQHRVRGGCRLHVGRDLRARSGARRVRRGADRGRQRYDRERDRQSLGTPGVSRADVHSGRPGNAQVPYRSKAPWRVWPERRYSRRRPCCSG